MEFICCKYNQTIEKSLPLFVLQLVYRLQKFIFLRRWVLERFIKSQNEYL